MKKALYIGAGLIIGSATTIFLLNKNKLQNDMHQNRIKSKQATETNEIVIKDVVNRNDSEYEDMKNSIVESVSIRHNDASSIMKESVEKIRENSKVTDRINKEIEEISMDLDKMLGED